MSVTRREFVAVLPALALAPPPLVPKPATGRLGIATTSIGIRRAQMRKRAGAKDPVLDAEAFLDVCHGFGTDGAQLDYNLLASHDPVYLRRVRDGLERRGMFAEFIVGNRALEDLALL